MKLEWSSTPLHYIASYQTISTNEPKYRRAEAQEVDHGSTYSVLCTIRFVRALVSMGIPTGSLTALQTRP